MNQKEGVPKSQEEIMAELRAIIESLSPELNDLLASSMGSAFLREMIEKYPELPIRHYRLLHLLLRSTPAPNSITGFDLPGGEIEKFIRELAGK